MKHTKNRVIALLMALAMVLSLMPMAFAADEFPDMPAEDDASYAAVKSAVDNGIMGGENGMLNLEGTILRSTVSKMVVMAFAAKGEADLSGYPDVEDGKWYVEWMAKAAQMGIMSGSYGKMNPSNEVTLAEVATMLVRALGLPTDKTAKLDGVADWAAPFVKALIDAGYISADAAADAGKPMTRAAFAEVIYKVSGEGNYVKEGQEITEDVADNIVITADGVTLKGITVKGDVIIADGVDAGSIVFDNVKIEGRLVVRGGAEAELKNGTTASATVVAKTSGEVTVKADVNSDAGDITVSGTNNQVADKVTVDMPEPSVTVTAPTEVAVQNANGGEITLQASGASLSVESGTVANVTVADNAADVKVDVAEGATIEKVTTNEDITITGEGTVEEKEGSGTVTDAEGNEVAGSDEPVEVPTAVSGGSSAETATPPAQTAHVHNYATTGAGVVPLNATQHLLTCVDKDAVTDTDGNVTEAAIEGCGAVVTVKHDFSIGLKADGTTVTTTAAEIVFHKCVCGQVEQKVNTTVTGTTGAGACTGDHHWVIDSPNDTDKNKDATCTEDGIKTWKCDKEVTAAEGENAAVCCTAVKVETTPAKGHNLVLKANQPATCGTDGYQDFYCTVCEKYKKADGTFVETLPANTHTVTIDKASVACTLVRDTSVDVAATCKATGTEGWKCSVCQTNQNKTLAKNPNNHVWSAWAKDTVTTGEGDDAVTTDAGTHSRTCTGGDGDLAHAEVKETRAHTWVLDTTDANKAVTPTCAANGKAATYKCSDCNATKGGETLPKTSHIMSAAWTGTADGHWHKCANCNTFDTWAAASSTSPISEGGPTPKALTSASDKHDWTQTVTTTTNGVSTTGPAPGAHCTTCGYVNPVPCTNAAKHGELHEGEACSAECGTVGTKAHTFVNGECSRETCNATCTTETCPNSKNHTDPTQTAKDTVICNQCGLKGTKEEVVAGP